MLFKKGPEGEDEALKYLQEAVPPEGSDKEVDTSNLLEELFEIPEDIQLGHHEFEGKNDYKVSFDLSTAPSTAFSCCIEMFNGYVDFLQGTLDEIYYIKNLKIKTHNFTYDSNEHKRPINIIWVPTKRSVNSTLSKQFVDFRGRTVYMLGKDGFFSRPGDLLGYFHETGHIKTRTNEQLDQEKSTRSNNEPFKDRAYELQREIDANDWMIKNTNQLFGDLGVPADQVLEYVRSVLLESYYKSNREVIKEALGECSD